MSKETHYRYQTDIGFCSWTKKINKKTKVFLKVFRQPVSFYSQTNLWHKEHLKKKLWVLNLRIPSVKLCTDHVQLLNLINQNFILAHVSNFDKIGKTVNNTKRYKKRTRHNKKNLFNLKQSFWFTILYIM